MMKTVVPASGKGSRLRPPTSHRPKPMLSVGEKPLLESVVESIATASVNEIILVVGYHSEQIQDYFGDGDQWNVAITSTVQEKLFETGHALLKPEPYIESDFIPLKSDQYIESQIIEYLITERRETEISYLAMTCIAMSNFFGVVELDDQTVTAITLGDEILQDMVFSGLVVDNTRRESNVIVKPSTIIGDGGMVNNGIFMSRKIGDRAVIQRG